jgi:hypothetical protein
VIGLCKFQYSGFSLKIESSRIPYLAISTASLKASDIKTQAAYSQFILAQASIKHKSFSLRRYLREIPLKNIKLVQPYKVNI